MTAPHDSAPSTGCVRGAPASPCREAIPRFLEKAQGLPADQVFLDLEDACAPLAKPEAPGTPS